MNLSKLQGAIEAVLFASGEPVSVDRLSEALETDRKTVGKMLAQYAEKLNEASSGLQLLMIDDKVQICTKLEFAPYVKNALDLRKNTPLSQAALEVLAIIAYNQPVTKSFVEQVRGIDSSTIVNNLAAKGLVEEAGRLDIPGKPIGYKTTDNFLRCFGITSLQQLPPLPEGGKAVENGNYDDPGDDVESGNDEISNIAKNYYKVEKGNRLPSVFEDEMPEETLTAEK